MHVIGHQQHRPGGRRDRQEVQRRNHQWQDRHRGIGIAAENRREDRTVPCVQVGHEILQAEHHLIEAAQREGLLGLDPQNAQNRPPIGRRALTQLLEEHGLADTGITGHHHRTLGVPGQHPVQLQQFNPPAHHISRHRHD